MLLTTTLQFLPLDHGRRYMAAAAAKKTATATAATLEAKRALNEVGVGARGGSEESQVNEDAIRA